MVLYLGQIQEVSVFKIACFLQNQDNFISTRNVNIICPYIYMGFTLVMYNRQISKFVFFNSIEYEMIPLQTVCIFKRPHPENSGNDTILVPSKKICMIELKYQINKKVKSLFNRSMVNAHTVRFYNNIGRKCLQFLIFA